MNESEVKKDDVGPSALLNIPSMPVALTRKEVEISDKSRKTLCL